MKSAFSRRGPDIVAEELAAVLSTSASFEFKPLFEVLHTNLRARNAAKGGEEMLRLRAYEKLQSLVQQGIVKKTGKEYRGVATALGNFLALAADRNASFALGKFHEPSPRADFGLNGSPSKVEVSENKSPEPQTQPKGLKVAETKLPVRKAQKGPGKKGQEGRKTAAEAK